MRLIVLGMAVAGGLVVAEIALQVLAHSSPRLAYLWSRTQPRHLADPVLGLRGHPFYRDHDDRGFRNALAVEKTCLLTLGDSMTYGHKVRRREAWPQVLAAAEGVSLYNMAYGGWGPGQGLILLEDGLALNPRLVLYGFYTGNDLWDSYHQVYGRDSPMARMRNPNREFRDLLASLPQPTFEPAPMVATRSPEHAAPRAFLARHSAIYGVFRTARRAWATRRDQSRDPYFAKDWAAVVAATAGRERFHVFEDDDLRTVFTPSKRRFAVDRADPRIAEGYRLSLRIADQMARLGSRNGTSFAVLLIPTKELTFCPWVGHGEHRELEHLCRLEARLLDDLESDLEGLGIHVIPALPALRRAIEAGEQPFPISANSHPNARGHRALAEAATAGLADRFPEILAACRENP